MGEHGILILSLNSLYIQLNINYIKEYLYLSCILINQKNYSKTYFSFEEIDKILEYLTDVIIKNTLFERLIGVK